MSTHSTDADAGAISFAYLAGLARPIVARADADEDKGDDEKDGDEEDKKSKKAKKAKADDTDKGDDSDDKDGDEKAEDDSDNDADMEEEEDDKKASSDDEEDDEDEAPKKKKPDAKTPSGARTIERTRWASVLGNKTFARNPALAARLLATTGMSANAILSTLRDTPRAVGEGTSSASSGRAARNPTVGTGAAPRATSSNNDGMVAAMLRARGLKK